MQEDKQTIKEYLEKHFEATVRENAGVLKMNLEKLDQEDIRNLAWIPTDPDIFTKRSGTGLVVIIKC